MIDPLRARTVVWYTDNQNVARIVNVGSKIPALQRMGLDIHRLSLLASVSIDMEWIPRDLNIIADDISKFVDLDDYSINDGVFHCLDELWGPHTCDRLLAITTPSFQNSTQDSISQAPLVSMPWHRIGPMTTTGSAPRLSN